MPSSSLLIASLTNLAVLLFLIMKLTKWITKNKIVISSVMFVAGFIFIFVPCYHGITLVQIMRGSLGDLSVCGFFVFFLLEVGSIWGINSTVILPKPLCALLVVIGALLYMATFAYIKTDLYALGYTPTTFVLFIIFLLELFVWYLSPLFALIWLIGLVSFYFQLQVSVNLWDYLFDPILWLITIRLLIKNNIHSMPINEGKQPLGVAL